MPAWSPEIANEFIRLSSADNRMLNQMQLQKLVYIAHGWCLAFHSEPLTGDRPEAWDFGPVYRRLADALMQYGTDPVSRLIAAAEVYAELSGPDADQPAKAQLASFEHELIAMTYEDYGQLPASQLSALTSNDVRAPWAEVYGEGQGLFRDIHHKLIKTQFEAYAESADLP